MPASSSLMLVESSKQAHALEASPCRPSHTSRRLRMWQLSRLCRPRAALPMAMRLSTGPARCKSEPSMPTGLLNSRAWPQPRSRAGSHDRTLRSR
ncbi:uncharacterized protein B0I36DRAFT_309700 [Microdochium trichocladiopsis]|uniref:Uncharacterized protein n=1 Tax=Microdochium trichocladiopsis TaxID=1682393 RepID=A0A9P8YH98_9PEZI|nr:uncharacterized protein B0I36DRAFT_309700 [Microdochium trichocladiopsis]KAH7039968.1 hypothetical protein B0I36DRAFT_309700 [Microdochium trichocladiopsis]